MKDNALTVNENANNYLDQMKWVLSLLSIVSGAYLYYKVMVQYDISYRILTFLPFLLLSCWIIKTTKFGGKMYLLGKESVTEARKVVWPTKSEANQTTLAVLAVVVIAGIILWLIDITLNWLTSMIVG